jgi:topoisomerase-4 subunit A
LRDALTFTMSDGLTVRTGGRHRTFEKKDIANWIGKRAQAGRLPPQGFPRSNTFS